LEGKSILAGITRDSVIQLAKALGYDVVERSISIEEVYRAHADGKLEDVFGTGTAAVISPVGVLNWNDQVIEINGGQMGEFAKLIYDKLTGIQYGREEDRFGWIQRI